MAGEIGIDWKSAAVRDGRLRVKRAESAPKGWVEMVNVVVERLTRGGQGWGEVKATRKRLEIAGVEPGAEESLRHTSRSASASAWFAFNGSAAGRPARPGTSRP